MKTIGKRQKAHIVRQPVAAEEVVDRSIREATTVGEEVIRRIEDAVDDHYATAVRESTEFSEKLLSIAHANAEAYFEWARELVGVTSPAEFITVSTRHAHRQFQNFGQQTRELVAISQKAAMENLGPFGTLIGSALVGRPDLS